ncbi:hypothetical protein CEE44_03645 [Candidatus Woesearchaeota archaeon B3_Woes]|nr:MAG: hypothetical protein CEE44_03645 [Candidatus Woesearchaeota archaeon B3_Woes]
MEIKKIGILIVIFVLISSFVAGVEIVPRGDSIEIRHTANWDINEVDNYLVNQNPDPAEPGGYVELRFKVENIGADYANDVMFELVPTYPFTLDRGMSAIRKAGEMHMSQVGEEAFMLYYKLRVDKDAVEGDNPIKLKYTNDGGFTWVQVEFDVRIQTHDAVLNVESVESDPEEVTPGSTITLTVNLENMADSLLKDVRVNLGILTKTTTTTSVITDELPFTPIGSTNEKFIENIGAHESKDISFKLIADADASSKVYKLPLVIEYSDGLGTNYTKTYYTSLIIGERPDLVTSIDSSEIVSAGEVGVVSLKFTNKGSSDIKFLYVELMQSEKYDIISPAAVYVGNIDSDDYESVDFNLYVKRTRDRMVQLPLRLDYRDANNKVFKKDVILNMKLYSSSEAKKYGLKESNGFFGKFILFLLIAGGVWYYRRKKKGKKDPKIVSRIKEIVKEKLKR